MRARLIVVVLLTFGCGREPAPSPWQAIELGTDAEFRDIFFLDARNGWMVGEVGVSVPGGIVARTRDGGLTWHYRTGVVGPRYGSSSVDLNAVYFVDAWRGVIAAESGTIVRSEDGGETWEGIPPIGPVHAHHRDLDFVDGDNGWLIGALGVLRTDDGGATWTKIDENLASAGEAIDMIDERHGWMVGRHGQVWRTQDGGVSWSSVPALGDLTARSGDERPFLASVCFVDADRGWVAGSWDESTLVQQIDRAVIIHTRDGGRTWSHQIEDARLRLNAIAFADPDRGWAVGFDRNAGSSTVLATVDGGSTWTVEHTVEGENLQTLEIRDHNVWTVGRRVHENPQRLLRRSFGAARDTLGGTDEGH